MVQENLNALPKVSRPRSSHLAKSNSTGTKGVECQIYRKQQRDLISFKNVRKISGEQKQENLLRPLYRRFKTTRKLRHGSSNIVISGSTRGYKGKISIRIADFPIFLSS